MFFELVLCKPLALRLYEVTGYSLSNSTPGKKTHLPHEVWMGYVGSLETNQKELKHIIS